jgi:hypothetical protein
MYKTEFESLYIKTSTAHAVQNYSAYSILIFISFLVRRKILNYFVIVEDVIYLGWPIAPWNMSPNEGWGEGVAGVSANKYSWADGAQINLADLTPYFNLWSLPKNSSKSIVPSPFTSYSITRFKTSSSAQLTPKVVNETQRRKSMCQTALSAENLKVIVNSKSRKYPFYNAVKVLICS